MSTRRSLTRRLLGTVLLLELVSALVLIGAGIVYEWRAHVTAFDVMLRGHADTVLGAVGDAEDPGDNVMLDMSGLALPKSDVYRVLDEKGRVLGQSQIAVPENVLSTACGGTRPLKTRILNHAYRVLCVTGTRVVDPGDANGGVSHRITVVYGSRTGRIRHDVFRAVSFYASATILLVILTSVAMIWLLGRDLAPLHQLAREAEKISARNWLFSAPAAAEETVELAPLAHAIEAALSRLQFSFEQQRRFTSDAAHELKTDVAIAKSSLQLLTMRSRSVEEYQRGLELCLDDCTRLERTVQEMLTLARVEQEPSKRAGEAFGCSMQACLEAGLRQTATFAELRRVQVAPRITGRAWVKMDERDAVLLCSNLLLNALEHSPADSVVRVGLTSDGSSTTLTIEDEGEGIAERDLPFIFEPFYRGDPSRNRKSGGTGLGLAICKAICERAGGAIAVRNREGRGAEALVTLPLQPVPETVRSGFSLA